MSIRDLKNRARAQLHDRMSDLAIYVPVGGGVLVPCAVRVHHRQKAFGDMVGFDYAPAERMEISPEVVALAAEVAPTRGGVFSIAPGIAYRVETPMPIDGLTITAQVTKVVDATLLASLPIPGA